MAQQVINIGTAPNDNTGDPIRTVCTKVNANFAELYSNSLFGTNFAISANNITVTNENGNINLAPPGLGRVRVVGESLTITNARTPTSAIGLAGDTAGMIVWDANYVYVCVANYDGTTAIWKRSALSTWI